jgi:hypothetical protein
LVRVWARVPELVPKLVLEQEQVQGQVLVLVPVRLRLLERLALLEPLVSSVVPEEELQLWVALGLPVLAPRQLQPSGAEPWE